MPTLTRSIGKVFGKRNTKHSVVVVSTSNPYALVAGAQRFAAMWGSRFVNIGDYGHIDADAGFGP